MIACICIEQKKDSAYLGFFAVHPSVQGQGIGDEVLSQAENFASKNLNLQKYVMVVVSQRTELIAYYERRGYCKTGQVEPYPVNLNVGKPLSNDLTIAYLEKRAKI